MQPADTLRAELSRLDGADYGAYQTLRGGWRFPRFELHMERIPKDPFAPPGTGVYRVRVPRAGAGFGAELAATPVGAIALRDFLARRFHRQCAAMSKGRRGTGHGGIITIAEPGQAILERTSVALTGEWVEARCFIGLPARRRRILADVARAMLFEELPVIVASSLFAEGLDGAALARHVATAEDADALRSQLPAAGLVGFVADGARLPRASGVDPRPLESDTVVPFRSPESLRREFTLPHGGTVTGMGIPAGVTLIAGGGYHGKSTLLQALEAGIENHVPGDGRELCVALPDTVKVRAASGRSVTGTDISATIAGIPLGADTRAFSTANASGSTSQAAFVAEAIEVGATVLLMDEDTCATNFMIRDRRMQELVAKTREPITAFVDKVRQLYVAHGVSTVLVMGGSGDYFGAADCVIRMTEFAPEEVTAQAHEIARRLDTGRVAEGGADFPRPRPRRPLGQGLDPHNEFGRLRVTAVQPRALTFGQETVELADLEQLTETAQTRAIGRAILHTQPWMDGQRSLAEIAERLMSAIRAEGLDLLDAEHSGQLAAFRRHEFAAALNRMRRLQVRQDS